MRPMRGSTRSTTTAGSRGAGRARHLLRALTAVAASAALAVAGAQSSSADSSYKLYVGGHMVGWGYFHAYGDKFGVYDNWPDGHSVVVQWTASSKGGAYFRCWDHNGAANGPEECNDQILEGAKVTWRVCTAEYSTGQLLNCSGWLVDYA